jgi:hypothetical protein
MALRHLGARAGATPLDVNKTGKENFAFAKDSSSAFVRKLIDCQKGIVSQFEVYALKEDPKRISELITGTIAGEGVVLAHVDYNGNEQGDHWVLIFRQEDDEFIADDSAIGTHVRFDAKTLKADCMWRDQPKTYEIKRIIPIKREN